MPLALRAPLRSTCLALCSSLRLILPLEGLPGDVANDFPAALDFLDGRHSLLPPKWCEIEENTFARSDSDGLFPPTFLTSPKGANPNFVFSDS